MPVPRTLTTATHQDFELEVVAGTWPADISGEVLISSPTQSGNLPYAIFDWGSICRLSLTPGARGAGTSRFAWQSRTVQTPGKRLADLHPEAFTAGAVGYNSPFGSANAANTAPLPWGDRLFVTWDAGRPVELDPDTLEFVAEVGHVDAWGGSSMEMPGVLPFIFSTAHPVVDPDRGCLWTVKLEFDFSNGFGLRPVVVRWDGDGTTVRSWPLDRTFSGSLHTVSQTRDWLILADSGNFKADAGEALGGERSVTVDDEVPVWLIRKEQLESLAPGSEVTPYELTMSPPTGHYYARWDDTDGVSVMWEGMDLMDLGLYMRPGDLDLNGEPIDPAVAGLYNMAMAPETMVEVQFEPETGKVLERGVYREDWLINKQLSTMDWSTEGMSRPTLHHLVVQGCKPGNVSQRAAALYGDRIPLDKMREETGGSLVSFERGSMELKARWDYPDLDELISSPTFVPRDPGADPGASRYAGTTPGGHDGYVVLPVMRDEGFRVDVFDAARVGDGPVATLAGTNDECVPVLLHSAWMPTVTTGLAAAERLAFADEITDERLASVPEELRPAVHQVADELGGAR